MLDLFRLSSAEIEAASGKLIERTQLLNNIVWGEYPEIHAKGISPSQFFRSYVATYVERDVRRLVRVKSAQDFGRFMRLVAARTGQLVSATAIASDLGLSAPTVREWLNVLQASQIISLVEPWFGSATNRLVKANKLYFLDTALCCHLLNIESPNQLLRSPHLGALFETHAFLKRFGTDSVLSKSLCCSRRGLRKLHDYSICDSQSRIAIL